MLKRVITGLIAICVLVPVLILSKTVALPISIAIVSVISLYEIFKCMGLEKKLYLSVPIYLFGAASPFLLRYNPFENTMAYPLLAFVFSAFYLIYIFTIIVWSHGKLKFSDLITVFAMSAYIIAAMCCIMYVRDYNEVGGYLYLLIFISSWITDIFAYFTGFLFGKHRQRRTCSLKIKNNTRT